MSYDEIKEAFQELLKKPDFTKNEIRLSPICIIYNSILNKSTSVLFRWDQIYTNLVAIRYNMA